MESQPASAQTWAESDHVQIPGFGIDQVEKVVRSSWSWSQFSSDTHGPTGLAAQLLAYDAECLDISQAGDLPFEQILDAHWCTLVVNNVTGQSPASADYLQLYLDARRWWAALQKQEPLSTEPPG